MPPVVQVQPMLLSGRRLCFKTLVGLHVNMRTFIHVKFINIDVI